MNTKVSFFGHRNAVPTNELTLKIKNIVENLICEYHAQEFLFGSKSNFDSLCYDVVSSLTEKYPHIRRIAYSCKSEKAVTHKEKERLQKALKSLNTDIELAVYEEERSFKTKYVAGKASYVERNYAMIDDSDICVFYYQKDYLPPKRKHSKNALTHYQPQSGTKLALNYAKQKNKTVIVI